MARDFGSPRSSSALLAWAAGSALIIGCTLDTEGGLSTWVAGDAAPGAGGALLDASADHSAGGAAGTGGKSGSGGSSAGGASGHGGTAQGGGAAGSSGAAGSGGASGAAGSAGMLASGGAAGQTGAGGSGTGGQSTCPGECAPGETDQISCGSGCTVGVQHRECSDSCFWHDVGDCVPSPACSAGAAESNPCGCGGKETRTCLADCTWGGWQACIGGEEACTPGEVVCDCATPGQGRVCGADGCPGTCANVVGACVTCAKAGESCVQTSDCCDKNYCVQYTGSTQYHKCAACKAVGSNCYGADQCCSGSCSSGSPGTCQ